MKISIKTISRFGGLLYLINIVFGIFAIGYVPGKIIVSQNTSLTAQNLIAHETLYRIGVAAHSIILITNVLLAIIFYRLFRVVNKQAVMLVIYFTLMGTAIEAVSLVNQLAPLYILNNGSMLHVFNPEQLQSLAYMFLKIQTGGFNIALIFFGCYCILIGLLIFRSGFLPKTIGVFMAAGGVCYLFNSFSLILDP